MITLLQNNKPVELTEAVYSQSVIVEWLHGGNRVPNTLEQRRTQTGPASVIPQAIFTIGENDYLWETVEW